MLEWLLNPDVLFVIGLLCVVLLAYWLFEGTWRNPWR